MNIFNRIPLASAILGAFILGHTSLLATVVIPTIEFTSDTDLTYKFKVLVAVSGNVTRIASDDAGVGAGGFLRLGAGTNGLVLDTTPDTTPTNTFTSFILDVDVRFGATPTPTIGLAFGSRTAAVMMIFNPSVTVSSDRQMRTFTGTNLSVGTAGTLVAGKDQTVSSTIAVDQWTHLRFEVTQADGMRTYTMSAYNSQSIFDTSTLVMTQTYSVAGTALVGEIGLRTNQSSGVVTDIDNFTVSTSTIPEPATYAALAGLALFGCTVWSRRSSVVCRKEAC